MKDPSADILAALSDALCSFVVRIATLLIGGAASALIGSGLASVALNFGRYRPSFDALYLPGLFYFVLSALALRANSTKWTVLFICSTFIVALWIGFASGSSFS
jgi:hypothetical protein